MKNEFLNFDGWDGEESQMLDFNGDIDDSNFDEDFDNLFGKKAKARRQERKLKRLEKRGDDVGSSADAPTEKKDCVQFYQDKGMSKRSAILKCKASKLGDKIGNTIADVGDAVVGGEELTTENGMPTDQGQKLAGLGGKKGLLIAGGVLALGLIGFFALRPRN